MASNRNARIDPSVLLSQVGGRVSTDADGTTSVRVSSDIRDALRVIAAFERQSLREIVDITLRDYIRRYSHSPVVAAAALKAVSK